MGEDALHRFSVRLVQDLRGLVLTTADQFGKPSGDLSNRQDEICKPGRDCAARHRAVLGLVRVLDQDDAASLLDGLDADRSARPPAGKNNGKVVTTPRGD